jgi:tetratricopeptide (TPR) repeat protein
LKTLSRLFVSSLPLVFACAVPPPAEKAIRFPDLGAPTLFSVHTNPEAQAWFDQGLAFHWGFNHGEAITSFERAFELDPTLGLAQVYIALAHGPNINDPVMGAERLEAAREASLLGLALCREGRDHELAAAVEYRFAEHDAKGAPEPSSRAHVDAGYSARIEALTAKYADDAELWTLLADSLLIRRPWDQWTHDGKPQEGTLEAIAALDRALALRPNHPGANHLYIHALEASPHPERADAAADRLRTLVPGMPHLVHMPAHIDVRTGRYLAAIETNRVAAEADRKYSALRPRGGIYAVYRAHNPHFIVFAGMLAGRKQDALEGLAMMDAILTQDIVDSLPDVLAGFLVARTHAYVRFGMWDEILALQAPPASSPLRVAMHHYARGVAFAATGRTGEARAEQQHFTAAVAAVAESTMMGNNPARTALAIGADVLEGEIAYREGDLETAFSRLERAAQGYDALRYDEPASWMMSPRHALGALLLEAGRVEPAIAVYRKDLAQHPENVWSLQGLSEALAKANAADAEEVAARFAKAAERADIPVAVSCFCRTGKGG